MDQGPHRRDRVSLGGGAKYYGLWRSPPEFVRFNVDVIVTAGTKPVIAAKQVTSVVPIVFALAGDLVGTGLMASLARPGGNVTGLSIQSSDLAGKRLELLHEVLPNLRKLAILVNVSNPGGVLEMSEAEAAARMLGLDIAKLEIRRAEEIAPAFEAINNSPEEKECGTLKTTLDCAEG